MDWISILVSMGVPSAVTGLCFWFVKRCIDRREREQREREQIREKSEVLLIRSVRASIALGEATATALKNGHTNGETEEALQYARQVKHEQKDFLTEQGIRHIF